MTARMLAVLLLAIASPAASQTPAAPSLGELQEAAVENDPRQGQLDLLAEQTELRVRSRLRERLPTVALNGQGQLQSTTFHLPFELPGGARPPTIPRDSYDGYLLVRQSLYDAAIPVRAEAERARLAEASSGVAVRLHQMRQAVTDAYFRVLRLDAERDAIDAGVLDLEARLTLVRDRVEERAALPGEASALEAELLRRRQARARVVAEGAAAREVLSDLAGRDIVEGAPLPLPELAAAFEDARGRLDSVRERPEYARFQAERASLELQAEIVSAGERPRVSAFGRAGYGRPGLNPLNTAFESYWLTGVQLEWAPWRWGAAERDREVLTLQRRVVDTEEASFQESLRRAAIQEIAAVERLIEALRLDEQIVKLREDILAEARLRFDEGVITAAEYVDRETDLLAARLERSAHQVELAHARASFLTLLGIEIP